MKTLPNVGLSSAPIKFNNVDFPLPDGPIIDTNSPLFIVKLIFLRAITLPAADSNTLERFSTRKADEKSTEGPG
jgi:hypothetical protein